MAWVIAGAWRGDGPGKRATSSGQNRPEAPAEKTAEAAAAPSSATSAARTRPGGPPQPRLDRGELHGGQSGRGSDQGDDKVTLETLAKDVKLLKIGDQHLLDAHTGFLVMFMQAGFALVETGSDPGQERRPHDGDELRDLRHRHARLLDRGFAFMFGGLGPVWRCDGPNILDKMSRFTLDRQDVRGPRATRASSSPGRPTTRRS